MMQDRPCIVHVDNVETVSNASQVDVETECCGLCFAVETATGMIGPGYIQDHRSW